MKQSYSEIVESIKEKSWTQYTSEEAVVALGLLKKNLQSAVNDIEIMMQLLGQSPAGIWKISTGSCGTGVSIHNEFKNVHMEAHIGGELGRIDDRGNCY